MHERLVHVFSVADYDEEAVEQKIRSSRVLDQIVPGDNVLLKPNWVQEHHDHNDTWIQMITNPTVITATLRVVLSSLKGKGSVVIADSPMSPAHFEQILDRMPVSRWKSMCEDAGISLRILDLRDERWDSENGIVIKHHVLEGDPDGHIRFNLKGDASEFYDKNSGAEGFYGASYDTEETNRAHDGTNNEYDMSATVIKADVFINLPKVKTHRKAGLTCSLKNLVGVSTNKNLIPHHTSGSPNTGGDQFSGDGANRRLEGDVTRRSKALARDNALVARLLVPLKKLAKGLFGDNKATVRNGSWYGNDTIWRSILDLNKLLMYGNPDGTLREGTPAERKRYATIVDGIICGEGEGPLEPDERKGGFLACGKNALAVDCSVAKFVGLDWMKIPALSHAFAIKRFQIASFAYDDIVCSIDGGTPKALVGIMPLVRLVPASGWKGHIELQK